MKFQKFLEKLSSYASWIGVVGALLAFISFYIGSQQQMVDKLKYTSYSQRDIAKKLDEEVKNIKIKISQADEITKGVLASTEKQIQDIKEQQQRLLLLATTQNMDNTTQQKLIKEISERVTTEISKQSIKTSSELESKVKEIEGIILQNPIKALQIPFINREVTEIKQSLTMVQNKIDDIKDSLLAVEVYKSKVEALNDKIGQTNNWMIGIFGGLGVSILGLLIGNIFQHRKMTSNNK